MNTLRKSIIIGMTVLGLGGTTLVVQARDNHGHGAKHEQMQAKWGERAAKRQQMLHDSLKLAPNQEAAWTTYTGAIKAAKGERGERGERGAWKTMSAPDRMAKRIEMAKQHITVMESQLAATTAFYSTLTPEQKKLFDENSMRRGGHHRMKHGMKHDMTK